MQTRSARLSPPAVLTKLEVGLAILLCALSQSPVVLTSAPPAACDLYEAMAESARPSRERRYALSALADCPASAARARLLERAILQDDAPARQAALQSLETHLDSASIPFLIELYDREAAPDALAEELAMRYLSRLADRAPAENTGDLTRIFVQGLENSKPGIRQTALLGLGRLDIGAQWPRIYSILQSPATSPGDRIAALEAAKLMKNRQEPEARNAAIQVLQLRSVRVTTPELERAAIELLAELGGPRAFEALLIYAVRHPESANRDLLHRRLASLSAAREGPGAEYYALGPTSLHSRPTERSDIVGVVREFSVLYSVDATDLGYRLPPESGYEPRESNWLELRTTDGLRGWAHASRVQRFVIRPPGPDSSSESNASPPSPSSD